MVFPFQDALLLLLLLFQRIVQLIFKRFNLVEKIGFVTCRPVVGICKLGLNAGNLLP